jgi:hypothetical protein
MGHPGPAYVMSHDVGPGRHLSISVAVKREIAGAMSSILSVAFSACGWQLPEVRVVPAVFGSISTLCYGTHGGKAKEAG